MLYIVCQGFHCIPFSERGHYRQCGSLLELRLGFIRYFAIQEYAELGKPSVNPVGSAEQPIFPSQSYVPDCIFEKNFLFCGNQEAVENTAVICSLLASCKASQITPKEWFTDIIAGNRKTPKKSNNVLMKIMNRESLWNY